MEILTKNFLVYGTGSSGKSAVSFLLSRGAKKVYVYDDNFCEQLPETIILKNFSDVVNLDISCVVLSPGVQIIGNKNIELLKQNKIEYISEFGLGFKYCKGKKICITGTNGKTTTVNLIYQMLKTKFKKVFLCGNTDTPITQVANMTTDDCFVVCEVSSFALESAKIKPDICSILNITQDHISRHKTFNNYKNTKLNIAKYLDNNCYFICSDIFNIKTNGKIIRYSLENKREGAYLKNNYIYYKNKKIINKKNIKLLGEKNIENILCAVTISKILKINNLKIKRVIKNFKGLNHRLQVVCKIGGVTFVDDSKATNPDSTISAIKSFKQNIILLLGGSDKGYSYDKIFDDTLYIKKIITFGQMAENIKACAIKNNFKEVISFSSLKKATQYAMDIAYSGDVVLLSPACASFDEFKSYRQRGEFFCKFVKREYEE